MKKFLAIGAIILVALVALGITGYAYAQAGTPGMPGGMGPGRMGGGMMGGAGMGRGQMNGAGMGGANMGRTNFGAMHPYMVAEVAEGLGLNAEELQARLDAGSSMWAVAQEQGLTIDEFNTLMSSARTEALAKMVADGVITQAQADAMNTMHNGMGAGMGRGGHMGGQGMMNGQGAMGGASCPMLNTTPTN